MNYKLILSFVLCLTIFSGISAQEKAPNQLDKAGKKTGVWESYYDNGKVKSHGTFIDGHPIGELLKYYPGGILQAQMLFDGSGKTSYVKVYYEAGHLASEGKYIDQLKDSVWNYFSTYDKRKALTETYLMGKKSGESLKFYADGKVSELLNWKNDLKDGKWEQYYENGQIRLTGNYLNGMLDGNYICYNPDGSISITGAYKAGSMDGKWTYFNEDGALDMTVEYVNGQMLPNPEMDKRIEEFSKKVKDSIGNLDDVELEEMQ